MAMTSSQPKYGAPAAKKVKLEHDGSTPSTPQPQSATTTTTTPAPTYAPSAQWSNTAQIPIDPALTQQPASTPTPAPAPATPAPTSSTPAPTTQLQAQTQPHTPLLNRLNYQNYTAYGTSHYPQTYTPHHYMQYQTTQPATASTPASTSTVAPLSRQPTQAAEQESNVDISTLNDALGSAGLDLRAEEETLQRSQDYHQSYRSFEDRSRKQPVTPAFDQRILGATMRTIGTRHKVSRIPEDAVSYVALALRARLQALIEAMASSAAHRATAQFDHPPSLYADGTPMWGVVVRRDTRKQLEVLERIEREEEMRVRRERKERADAAAAAQAAQAAGGSPSLDGTGGGGSGADDAMDGSTGMTGKRPKKKKEGPGVTAKNMSEDVQKRLSNATAAQAAGLGRGKYAWMNAGGGAGAAARPKAVAAPTSVTPAPTATPAASQNAGGSAWTKPYVTATTKMSSSPTPGEEDKLVVTMRDAMFIIEREKGHGAGRGSARGWV